MKENKTSMVLFIYHIRNLMLLENTIQSRDVKIGYSTLNKLAYARLGLFKVRPKKLIFK